MTVNMAKFEKIAGPTLAKVNTATLAKMYDDLAGRRTRTEPEAATMALIGGEMTRRHRARAASMDTPAIIAELEPIADYQVDVTENTSRRREALLAELTSRFPAARAAEDAWADADADPDTDPGPVSPVIAAVRAALAERP